MISATHGLTDGQTQLRIGLRPKIAAHTLVGVLRRWTGGAASLPEHGIDASGLERFDLLLAQVMARHGKDHPALAEASTAQRSNNLIPNLAGLSQTNIDGQPED